MRLASFLYWASALHQSLALSKSTQPDNYLGSPADSKNADKPQAIPTGQPASIIAEPQDLNSNTNLRGSQLHLFSSPDNPPDTALNQLNAPPESAQSAQSQPKAPPQTTLSQPNGPPESAQSAQSQLNAPPESAQSAQSQPKAPLKSAQTQLNAPPESAQSAQNQPKAPLQSAQTQLNAPPETTLSQANGPPESAQSQPKAPPQSAQSQLNAPPESAQSQPNAETPVQPAPPSVTPDIQRPTPAFLSDKRLIETKGTTTTTSPTIMKASSAIQDWATAVEQKPSLRENLTSVILREVGGSGSGCLETREQNKCLVRPCYFVLGLNLCLPYCEAFPIESRCTEGCRWEKEACRTQMMLEPLAKIGSLVSIDKFRDAMGLDYINCASIIDEKFCTLMGERLKSLTTPPLTKDSELGVCKWDGNLKICVDEKFTMLGDAEKDDFLKMEKPIAIEQSPGCDAVHLKPYNGVLDPDKDFYPQGEKIQVKCDPGYQPSNTIRGTLVCSVTKLMPRIYCIPNPQYS